MKESRWTKFFGPDVSPKGSWRSLYKLPVEKWTADLQWRIAHGAIATNRYRAHLDPELGEECIFCSLIETLVHLFIQCPHLSALFELLKRWFQGLGDNFSFGLFIFGPKYCAKKKSVHTLVNLLFCCSERTTEGQTEGGAHFLWDDGQYEGLQSYMGCCRGFMLCGGGRRDECKFLIRETFSVCLTGLLYFRDVFCFLFLFGFFCS